MEILVSILDRGRRRYLSFHLGTIRQKTEGFTLIELSIVLVVIGLIAGGLLVGRDLISAAAVRAQVSQIERYQQAVNTFKGKYGYLPGDIKEPDASSFGFQSRGPYDGEGDGNGLLQGNCPHTAGAAGSFYQPCGELAVFWEDLYKAKLLDATILGYDTNGSNYPYTSGPPVRVSYSQLNTWIPQAKIGSGNYLYVWSMRTFNYFGLSSVDKYGWALESNRDPGLMVRQAYDIDKKIDDGLPQSGNVVACYINFIVSAYNYVWASGGLTQGTGGAACTASTTATAGSSVTCYDNGNAGGTPQQYSISQNSGAGTNCGLSIKFQ